MKRLNDPLAPELDTEELWKMHPGRMKRLASSQRDRERYATGKDTTGKEDGP